MIGGDSPVIRSGVLATLPPAQRLVYLVLWAHRTEDGHAWPGPTLLAAETGYNAGSVRRALGALADRGLIVAKGRVRAAEGRWGAVRWWVPEVVHTSEKQARVDARQARVDARLEGPVEGASARGCAEQARVGARRSTSRRTTSTVVGSSSTYAGAVDDDQARAEPRQLAVWAQLTEGPNGTLTAHRTPVAAQGQGTPPAAAAGNQGAGRAKRKRTSFGPYPTYPPGQSPLTSKAVTRAKRAREAAARVASG